MGESLSPTVGESLERGFEAGRQRGEVVAAFEHGREPWREGCAAARELTEAVHSHAHAGEWIVLVCVEARRYEDELGVEAPHFGLDDLVEGAHVLSVAAP